MIYLGIITDMPENDQDELWPAMLDVIEENHPEISDDRLEAYSFVPTPEGGFRVFYHSALP